MTFYTDDAIQDVIDNATAGDTIRVIDGTYEEDIDIGKTLTLIGNGTSSSIIEGTGINVTMSEFLS